MKIDGFVLSESEIYSVASEETAVFPVNEIATKIRSIVVTFIIGI
jgi:hypothetical protein